jgi:arsenate reductase
MDSSVSAAGLKSYRLAVQLSLMGSRLKASPFSALPDGVVMSTTIYHNARCGTSRTVLDHLREAGITPDVVNYLETPLTREQLVNLIRQAGIQVRDAVRTKEPVYQELGLDKAGVSDEQLLDAMIQNPILINRPFVVTDKGTRLCRPADVVNEIIPERATSV